MGYWYIYRINGVCLDWVWPICEVGNNLVTIKVKIYPVSITPALTATQYSRIKGLSRSKVMNGEGQMKAWAYFRGAHGLSPVINNGD